MEVSVTRGGTVSRLLQALLSWPVATGIRLQQMWSEWCNVLHIFQVKTDRVFGLFVDYLKCICVAKLDYSKILHVFVVFFVFYKFDLVYISYAS